MLRVAKLIAVAVALTFPGVATAEEPSAADQWERSLLDKKKAGTLPGPKPGQKCLWSKRLGACLWYTPGKFKPAPWIWGDR
jgi:hypothetical protein